MEEEAYTYFKESYFVYKTLSLPYEMKKLLKLLIEASKKLGLDEETRTYKKLFNAIEE